MTICDFIAPSTVKDGMGKVYAVAFLGGSLCEYRTAMRSSDPIDASRNRQILHFILITTKWLLLVSVRVKAIT